VSAKHLDTPVYGDGTTAFQVSFERTDRGQTLLMHEVVVRARIGPLELQVANTADQPVSPDAAEQVLQRMVDRAKAVLPA
jgi:hypothetical protein